MFVQSSLLYVLSPPPFHENYKKWNDSNVFFLWVVTNWLLCLIIVFSFYIFHVVGVSSYWYSMIFWPGEEIKDTFLKHYPYSLIQLLENVQHQNFFCIEYYLQSSLFIKHHFRLKYFLWGTNLIQFFWNFIEYVFLMHKIYKSWAHSADIPPLTTVSNNRNNYASWNFPSHLFV